MNDLHLREHVDLIREVFLYTKRFTGSLFVLKIDYRILETPLFQNLMKDIALLHEMGIRIVVVPGASVRIDQILKKYGIRWQKKNGIRITSPEGMVYIKMAAFDVSNRIMTSLSGSRVSAVIGNWVSARQIGILKGVDYQRAGVIEKVDSRQIQRMIDQGNIPIFPCIGWNSLGEPYNISSDELAYKISVELGAQKLFILRAEEGFLRGILSGEEESASKHRLSRINASDVDSYLEEFRDTISSEESALLKLASRACVGGVLRTHIIDGRQDGAILKEIFSNMGIGTMVHANPYECFRSMTKEDIPSVLAMMAPLIQKEVLIPRTEEDFYKIYQDYVVYEVDGSVRACGALHRYGGHSAEIAGIAVDFPYKSEGIGRKLVEYLLTLSKNEGFSQVFVLTTQTTDWFLSMGFVQGKLEMIPDEKRSQYNNDRKSRVLLYFLQ